MREEERGGKKRTGEGGEERIARVERKEEESEGERDSQG